MGDPEEYLAKTLVQIQKKKDITIKAGEMICAYLELDQTSFIYKRPNGEPTIVDNLDPIQLMIPIKKSRAITTIPKELSVDIMRDLIASTVKKLKDNEESVKLRHNQFQFLYHFLLEDLLWIKYDIDFEDFK